MRARGQGHCDHRANGVSEDRRPLGKTRSHELVHIIGKLGDAVAALSPSRTAMSAKIEGKDMEAGGEVGKQDRKGPPIPSHTVQEHEGQAGGRSFGVVDPNRTPSKILLPETGRRARLAH